jgi:hypothetical protein
MPLHMLSRCCQSLIIWYFHLLEVLPKLDKLLILHVKGKPLKPFTTAERLQGRAKISSLGPVVFGSTRSPDLAILRLSMKELGVQIFTPMNRLGQARVVM